MSASGCPGRPVRPGAQVPIPAAAALPVASRAAAWPFSSYLGWTPGRLVAAVARRALKPLAAEVHHVAAQLGVVGERPPRAAGGGARRCRGSRRSSSRRRPPGPRTCRSSRSAPGHVGGDELHAALHQAADEMRVPGQTIQLGDDQLRAVLLAAGQRLGELGAVVPPAALDLGELRDWRPVAPR